MWVSFVNNLNNQGQTSKTHKETFHAGLFKIISKSVFFPNFLVKKTVLKFKAVAHVECSLEIDLNSDDVTPEKYPCK